MNAIVNEAQFALRQLRKSPGFTAIVMLTLALGITATTVIFSLVDAVLLRPLPLPEPNRLVSLDTLERQAGTTGVATVGSDTSYPNFFDWRSQNRSFSSMAAYTSAGFVLGPNGQSPARHLNSVHVTSDFFTTLGIPPGLGRGFTRAEEQPGNHVAVLSYNLWQNEFAGDRSILGKTIVLSDVDYTVVGVMPSGFAFPISNRDTALWMTMAADAEGENPSARQRGWNQLSVVGRLRPGVTIAQAKAEMDTIQRGLAARYPDENGNKTAVSVVSQLQDLVSNVQTPLRILFAAVACLLLIVCTNVAGLMITRTSRRRGELAIRSALGATRVQILRQLLIESILLSLGGGALGLAATSTILRVLPGFLPSDLPRIHQIALSGEVLAFAVGLAVLTGLLFGVLPAWLASKQNPAAALAENGRSATTGRRQFHLQSILVVAQTAISLVLLVGAGLLIHSFNRTLHVDPGFDTHQTLTFRLAISPNRYTGEQKINLLRQILPTLKGIQGVQSATAAYPLPLTDTDINISFSIAGRPNPPGNDPSARVSLVEPDYFHTLRIPLLQGRVFSLAEHDLNAPPVVMINDAFARKFFPGQNPVGQHLRSGLGQGDPPPMREVVGVAGNVKRGSLTEPDQPEYYIPLEQAPMVANPVFALRVSGDPASYANIIRSKIARLDGTAPAYRLQSYDDELSRVTAQQRFQTMLLTAFAVIALLLAGLGLYAVLSYMVTQRTQELGLRIALGAQRSNVLKLMLVRGMNLALIGLAIGLAAAAILTRFVANLLYDTRPLDAATFTTMTLVLLAVSTIASLIPAWRASMLDPNDTLRIQ